eukprot:5782747-Pleurochrysis_carterae.AAC.2
MILSDLGLVRAREADFAADTRERDGAGRQDRGRTHRRREPGDGGDRAPSQVRSHHPYINSGPRVCIWNSSLPLRCPWDRRQIDPLRGCASYAMQQ